MDLLRESQPRSDFAFEVDLYAVLSRCLPKLTGLEGRGGVVRSEVQQAVGSVIPDVVLGHVTHGLPIRTGAPITGLAASAVAALLRRGPLRLSTLSEQLFIRPERLERTLSALVRRRVLSVTPGGAFVLEVAAELRAVRLVAVEAKLRRWREALAQASRYRTFATEAYIALPEGLLADRDQVQSEARALGIGIIAVGSSDLREVVPAVASAPRTADFVWLAFKMLADPLKVSSNVGAARANQTIDS